MSKPLQISPETAMMLAKRLNVPLEHLMHMPKHILLQKMAELARAENAGPGQTTPDAGQPQQPQDVAADKSGSKDKPAAEDVNSPEGESGP